jgi:hypothetical protein
MRIALFSVAILLIVCSYWIVRFISAFQFSALLGTYRLFSISAFAPQILVFQLLVFQRFPKVHFVPVNSQGLPPSAIYATDNHHVHRCSYWHRPDL